ncbi:MAG: hypothetical protein P9L97_00305 [Candidatus Tenebribacter davisii]|nr:hypothetical protein [Candidatus Tenebribacter davisii]
MKNILVLLFFTFFLVITSCIFSPDSNKFDSDFPEIGNGVSYNDLGFDYVLQISSYGHISLTSYIDIDSTYFQLNGSDINTTYEENIEYWRCEFDFDDIPYVPNLQPNCEVNYSWVINDNSFNGTLVIPLIDECVFLYDPELNEDMYIEWEETEDPQLHTISVYNFYSILGHWELRPSKRSFTINKSYFPNENQKPVEPPQHKVFISAINYDSYDNCLIYARSLKYYGWDPEDKNK